MIARRKSLVAAMGSSLALALVLVRALIGCLDVTPIYVAPRDAAAIDGSPCLACLSKSNAEMGCFDEIQTCAADTRCLPVYECMIPNACLDRPALDDKISCTVPCLQEAGIFGPTDPTVGLLVAIVRCGETGCSRECNLGDGGLGLDL